MTTGETHLQCDAHLAGNARRSNASKRRARGVDVLLLAVVCFGLVSSVVACEPVDGYAEPMDAPSSAAAGSAPSGGAGSGAVTNEPAKPEVVTTYDAGAPPTPVGGSAAPVPVVPVVVAPVPPTTPVAGSAAPVPSPTTPTPVAGAPAEPPVTATAAITHCKGASGFVRSCTENDEHYFASTYVMWAVTTGPDAAGPTYLCAGDFGAQGNAPACIVGAACDIVTRSTGAIDHGVCQ